MTLPVLSEPAGVVVPVPDRESDPAVRYSPLGCRLEVCISAFSMTRFTHMIISLLQFVTRTLTESDWGVAWWFRAIPLSCLRVARSSLSLELDGTSFSPFGPWRSMDWNGLWADLCLSSLCMQCPVKRGPSQPTLPAGSRRTTPYCFSGKQCIGKVLAQSLHTLLPSSERGSTQLGAETTVRLAGCDPAPNSTRLP